MQCLSGELGARDPYNMRWPMMEPFRIKWIIKGDISCRAPQKIENPFNGDMPVFVGLTVPTGA
jgi:hypothetical protein